MAKEITTLQLETDILSADVAGRARVATDFFTETEVDDNFADGAIDDDRLKNLGTTHLLGGRDMGRVCVGYFYLDGVSVHTETVTINGRTYGFDTGAGSGANVDIDVSAAQTAQASIDQFVIALNADADRVVDGVAAAGNNDTTSVILFIARAAQATQYTLTDGCTNGTVSAANHTGAAVMANRDVWTYEYTVTAADVTLLALVGGNSIAVAGVNSTTEPVITGLTLRDANGVVISLATVIVTALQANTNYWVIAVDDPATVLSNTDVLGFCLTV